jgi:hypothetical protein
VFSTRRIDDDDRPKTLERSARTSKLSLAGSIYTCVIAAASGKAKTLSSREIACRVSQKKLERQRRPSEQGKSH